MWLRSSALVPDKPIPRRFTCDGENRSPPLEWGEAPAGTRSLVLLCDDPDAPAGAWHHWAVYDLPLSPTSLAEGASGTGGLKQAVNDFRKSGYGGPCPPRGHGIHHYHFRLLALTVDRLPFNQQPMCRDVEREARKHAIAEAILIRTYER